MKMMVYRDVQMDESGVERVWCASCPDPECFERNIGHVVTLYWENAIRAASHHIAYHQRQESKG